MQTGQPEVATLDHIQAAKLLPGRLQQRSKWEVKYLGEISRALKSSVIVTNLDFTDLETVKKFVVNTLHIADWFNLGMVLADGLFNKMMPSQWKTPFVAKENFSKNFDLAFAENSAGEPDHFCVFSSVTAGLGNAGQSSYGYANSTLDTIIRARNARGVSALSVQWGTIGDVGVLARSASKKSGLLKESILSQPILECISSLERLLCAGNHGVYSVYVTPKRMPADGKAGAGADALPLADKSPLIIGDLGAKDSQTLENLGADSLQSMKLRNVIKARTGISLHLEKLQRLTIKELREMEK